MNNNNDNTSSNNNNKFTPSISVSLLGKNGNRFFAIFLFREEKRMILPFLHIIS